MKNYWHYKNYQTNFANTEHVVRCMVIKSKSQIKVANEIRIK